LDDGYQVFLEVGPHPVLRTYLNECSKDKEITILTTATAKRQSESKTALFNALYDCYLGGCPIDSSKIFSSASYTSIILPHYPWQREKYWYTLTPEGGNLVNRVREHPLLGYRLKNHESSWENQIDTQLLSYLSDHVVDGAVVFPAAAYVEMTLAASSAYFNTDNTDGKQWEVENIEIRAPILLDNSKTLRFKLFQDDGSFVISSRDRLSDTPWITNVVGRLLGDTNKRQPKKLALDTLINNAKKTITSSGHYHLTESVGLQYGPAFQGIEDVWVLSLAALAKIKVPKIIKENSNPYQLHPALLDAGFQVLVDIFADEIEQGSQAALIPVQIGKLYFYRTMQDLSYLHVDVIKQSPQSVVADYLLLDSTGEVLAELKNCRFRGVQLVQSKAKVPTSYEFKPWLLPFLKAGISSPISEPAALVSHARSYLEDHEKVLKRDKHYQEVLPLFDVMVSMFALQAIQELNPKGDEFTLKSLAEQAHIESVKLPLLARLLEILVEDDLASFENGRWMLATDSDLPSAEDIWLSVLGDSPEYLPELMLLGRCGKHLADVLQHNIDPDKILYSSKSSIQQHWSVSSPSNSSMNLALRDTVSEIISEWPANRRLRILEIGGNDTELSQLILPIIPTDICDYYYIHHDADLLSKAEFDLEQWRFVQTEQLDLSLDITTDNCLIELASFDIVIAANTLYHSDDFAKAQKNIRRLLTPKGVLLLIERQTDRFMDMTFGLQADWWIHTTDNLSPTPLLMSANTWRTQLKGVGFDQVELLIEPQSTGDVGAFMVVANHVDTSLNKESEVVEPEKKFSKTWMILKDSSELSSTVSNAIELELKKAGDTVVTVSAGATYKRLGPRQFSIAVDSQNSAKEEHFDHVIETLEKLDIQCDHIVHLMGLRWHSDLASSDSTITELQNLRCSSLVDLIQGLQKVQPEVMPRLHLVTSGGAVIANYEDAFNFDNNPTQAALWGLGRVVMNEHPELDCHLIDLQGNFDLDITSKLLIDELLLNVNTKENEVILSENVRHVLRMSRTKLDKVEIKDKEISTQNNKLPPPFSLYFSTAGQLKNLKWKELPDYFLRADEIEIKPHAAGLNFRDVMYAMGLLSDEAVENGFAGPTLGMELSGTVMAVGSAISEFKVGDAVVGFAPACFSSRVITQTTAITHKPKGWSFEEATTIPTTFFTVYYALRHLAQIQPGEKILIHGAAGGVGIAAIQFARYCGAEIFATAGSDEKRDFVRLLGADHVMDSRSLAFADDIMEITKGEGIDIVLNSLAGEAITRNLSVLKPFGRFLELGKRDFYENSKVGLRPFRNNISYFGIDADQLLIERPELANRLFKEMMSLFDSGSLRPMPYRSFPATRIQDAFRYMQQSRQIGKIVISFENGNGIPAEEIEQLDTQDEELKCIPTASYLVTGGLSGFGLKTACWLVEKGARSLILISRSAEIRDDDAKKTIRALQDKGVSVYIRACDVSDKIALSTLIAEVQREVSSLKGIIHAAMVLDDSLIQNMTQQQLLKVMSPKTVGAWNLHEATQDLNLDFFVLYSSATTFVGNPGQANYVAANGFMESLATYRKSIGLAASYVAWGAISDVGYLARNEKTKDALQNRLGGEALLSDKALTMLEKIIISNKAGAAVIDLDWGVIQKVMPAASSNKYIELQREVHTSDSDQYQDIQSLIVNLSYSEVQDLVVDLLLDEIEHILRIQRDKLDVETSIFDLGMDSLMGMELVLAIEDRFAVKLPVMALTEGANINRIAQRITEQLCEPDSEKAETSNQKDQHQQEISIAASRHGQSDHMTEKEVEELSKKLIEDAIKDD
jgi:NADPH:quinone reductase-like Zn-dependent oxidoreductase/acyl carrier protein/short-subunit dehydrogenase/SAM-dependent methyltransferase